MKSMYQHHYDKIVLPVYLHLYDIADYMSDDEYEELSSEGFTGIDATITIRREPAEPEVGIPVSYAIDDIDVAWADQILSREAVCKAATDYIWSNEDTYTSASMVENKFGLLDEERKNLRYEYN